MKKNATLLIQHLEQIYPMTPSIFSTISKGFVAIHHEEVLALGEGEGWAYVDKDTRILEGRNHIAIPGFIDIGFTCSAFMNIPSTSHDAVRLFHELSTTLLQHGTMCVNAPLLLPDHLHDLFSLSATIDLIEETAKQGYPIVTPLHRQNHKELQRFCISTGYPDIDCLDQLLCAKLYALQHPTMKPEQILAACTRYPAKAMRRSDLGILQPGKKANLLLLEGQALAPILHRFHGDVSMHVIKDGVRRYPYTLI